MTLLQGNGNGWGTREQAIPGEWAMLVLISVLGAALGFLVIWFTLLRHEKAVRGRSWRANRRSGGGMALVAIGPAVDEAEEPGEVVEAEVADEVPEDETESGQGSEPEQEQEQEPANEAGAAPAPRPVPVGGGRRKLTDDILNRVEEEIAGSGKRRWKDLAALVHHEFGVSVHPSSIQKALKRRNGESATDPASA